MPDRESGSHFLVEPPTKPINFEDETGRCYVFDPSRARLAGAIYFGFPVPSLHCLYEQDDRTWVSLRISRLETLIEFATKRPPRLPKGERLSRDRAIDWLLRHKLPIPKWLDISDRILPSLTPEANPAAIEHVPALSSVGSEIPLPHSQQIVLVAMLEAKAFDSDSRVATSEISDMSGATDGKRAIARLASLGLVETKRGRGGGAWLTALGKSRAESISSL